MTHHRIKRFYLGLAAVALVMAVPVNGFAATKYEDTPVFAEQPLADHELAGLRGGFVTRSGMIIDFAFSTNTLVDGQLINQITLNTADLVANAEALRSVIQIGKGNSAFSDSAELAALPNILTVVQNNLDDLTIQQVNLLDLSVQNFDSFTSRAALPELEFQNALTLAP